MRKFILLSLAAIGLLFTGCSSSTNIGTSSDSTWPTSATATSFQGPSGLQSFNINFTDPQFPASAYCDGGAANIDRRVIGFQFQNAQAPGTVITMRVGNKSETFTFGPDCQSYHFFHYTLPGNYGPTVPVVMEINSTGAMVGTVQTQGLVVIANMDIMTYPPGIPLRALSLKEKVKPNEG